MKQRPADGMLQDAVLVVAHPDDEALWFSSVLAGVNEVIVCFLNSPGHPELELGRTRSLEEYPVANISTLALDEPGAFNCADWQNPAVTPCGIEIPYSAAADRRYQENFRKLRALLESRLKGCDNVFTHNPWGEYGHEEHIQIYRAVESLQESMGFNLWFSNYCSNRSYNLMLEHIRGFSSDYITLATDKPLGEAAREIYQKNGCWTWMDDYQWFNEESFIVNFSQRPERNGGENGHIFPLNFMKLEFPASPGQEHLPAPSLPARLAGKIGRIRARLLGPQREYRR